MAGSKHLPNAVSSGARVAMLHHGRSHRRCYLLSGFDWRMRWGRRKFLSLFTFVGFLILYPDDTFSLYLGTVAAMQLAGAELNGFFKLWVRLFLEWPSDP